eukprot:11698967-Alexandrium_andersonii.AAC.1
MEYALSDALQLYRIAQLRRAPGISGTLAGALTAARSRASPFRSRSPLCCAAAYHPGGQTVIAN